MYTRIYSTVSDFIFIGVLFWLFILLFVCFVCFVGLFCCCFWCCFVLLFFFFWGGGGLGWGVFFFFFLGGFDKIVSFKRFKVAISRIKCIVLYLL